LASWRFNNEEPTAKEAKQLEETTNQTEIPLASSFVKATTLQIFRAFRVFRGQKILSNEYCPAPCPLYYG
jgi:hypothetical protein